MSFFKPYKNSPKECYSLVNELEKLGFSENFKSMDKSNFKNNYVHPRGSGAILANTNCNNKCTELSIEEYRQGCFGCLSDKNQSSVVDDSGNEVAYSPLVAEALSCEACMDNHSVESCISKDFNYFFLVFLAICLLVAGLFIAQLRKSGKEKGEKQKTTTQKFQIPAKYQ
jgi:hypothetical protein